MKIVKILLTHTKNMSEDTIKTFIYKNFTSEMITGLEYDDPKTIERALKLLGIHIKLSTISPASEATSPKASKDMHSEMNGHMQKTAAAS